MIFEADSGETAAQVAAGGMVGTLDIVIIGGVLALAAYWFFGRKKEDETSVIKPLKVITAEKSDTSDPSFINKMKTGKRNVVIFFGSQTGTAEEFASRLSKDCSKFGWKGLICDPEECEMEDLTRLSEIENSLAIFCMATYGEGDPTDNAQEFYEWLQSSDADLSAVKFGVFGLGNKTYEHFNFMGKYVDQRMVELGAQRIQELGLGDDDANIEEDFVTWKEKFWESVSEHYGIQAGEDVSMRQYSLTMHDEMPQKVFTGEMARYGSYKTQKAPYDSKNPYLAPVSVNRELHNGGDRSCMHIEFDISGSKMKYEAGDHIAVYPTNDTDLVEGIGDRLEADLGQVITLTNVDEDASKKHPFPNPTSYRTALTHYLDITNTPRTNVLKELSEYASDPKDKEFLLKISSTTPEGKELYNDWIMKDLRHILAVLEDLPSVKPPVDHLCELLPRLQPRYYSISSSPKLHPDKVHITAVLVKYETRAGRTNKGVATTYLKHKMPLNEIQPTVPVFIRKSQFRLPFKPSVPVIMVGPGTGLAPFRGFIQDRQFIKQQGKPVGDTILYFGCRHKAEDYIYQDEVERHLEDGSLSKIYLAFSRDQKEKVYVQHLMRQNKAEIWKVLENNGHIYVCGDARNMARDVHQVLTEVIMEEGGLDETKAQEYIKRLQSRGRYSQDVWS